MSITTTLQANNKKPILTIAFRDIIEIEEQLSIHPVDIEFNGTKKTILFDGGMQSFNVLQETLQSLVHDAEFTRNISQNFMKAGNGLSADEIALVDILTTASSTDSFNPTGLISSLLTWLDKIKRPITPDMQRRILSYSSKIPDFKTKILQNFNDARPPTGL